MRPSFLLRFWVRATQILVNSGCPFRGFLGHVDHGQSDQKQQPTEKRERERERERKRNSGGQGDRERQRKRKREGKRKRKMKTMRNKKITRERTSKRKRKDKEKEEERQDRERKGARDTERPTRKECNICVMQSGAKADMAISVWPFPQKHEVFVDRRNSSESDQTGKSCLLSRESSQNNVYFVHNRMHKSIHLHIYIQI